MTKDSNPRRQLTTTTTGMPGWIVGGIALLILVGYGYFTFKMLCLVGKSTDVVVWERALLIFRSVEALAFAAAGVILGVQIQRTQVETAENKAQQAEARAQADQAKLGATEAKTKSDLESIKQEVARIRADTEGGTESANIADASVRLRSLEKLIDAKLGA